VKMLSATLPPTAQNVLCTFTSLAISAFRKRSGFSAVLGLVRGLNELSLHATGFVSPSLAAVAPSGGPLDAIIIGAGAAGIAAARRLAAAGRRYLVIEATDHVGGRCITDTTSFGVPFDRGAHWIYLPDSNTLIKVGPRRGDIYPASLSQKIRIGRRYAREGELEDYLSAQVRATRAIGDAGRKADTAAAPAMPTDLGDWRATTEFVLGPYNCGKDLAQVSSLDFAKAAERRSAAFCLLVSCLYSVHRRP